MARRRRAGRASDSEGTESMADDPQLTGQDEIEQLLQQGTSESPLAAAPRPSRPPAASGEGGVSQDDIELLLRKAEQALASIDEPVESLPDGVQ
jgi:hypothetical protein